MLASVYFAYCLLDAETRDVVPHLEEITGFLCSPPPRGKGRQMGTVVNIMNAGRWRDLEIWAGHGDRYRYAEAVVMVSSFSDYEGYRKSPRTSVISHLQV